MDVREVYEALFRCWPYGISPQSYPILAGLMCAKLEAGEEKIEAAPIRQVALAPKVNTRPVKTVVNSTRLLPGGHLSEKSVAIVKDYLRLSPYRSLKSIAVFTGLSLRTVRRATKYLVMTNQCTTLTIVRRGRTKLYRMLQSYEMAKKED